ncbi:MAG: RsmG family class I SAM-dependent methyltransferase [Candidatus Aegiribacteria sp.]
MNRNEVPPRNFPSREAMASDLEELGIEAEPGALRRMTDFSLILLKRSRFVNLIGPAELNRLWRRHYLESCCYSLLMESNEETVDIGTGNGFPGLVLAILGFRMVLLEPRRKRFLFLRHAAEELGLVHCRVEQCRLEDFTDAGRPARYTARSVAPPEKLLEIIDGISGEGSTLVCRQPGVAADENCHRTVELRCPPLDRSGFLVQYRV